MLRENAKPRSRKKSTLTRKKCLKSKTKTCKRGTKGPKSKMKNFSRSSQPPPISKIKEKNWRQTASREKSLTNLWRAKLRTLCLKNCLLKGPPQLNPSLITSRRILLMFGLLHQLPQKLWLNSKISQKSRWMRSRQLWFPKVANRSTLRPKLTNLCLSRSFRGKKRTSRKGIEVRCSTNRMKLHQWLECSLNVMRRLKRKSWRTSRRSQKSQKLIVIRAAKRRKKMLIKLLESQSREPKSWHNPRETKNCEEN